MSATPELVLCQFYAYAGNAEHEAEAQETLQRFKAALAPLVSVELRYERTGRNREALIVATNGDRPRPFRLNQQELERVAFSALCGALGNGPVW